MQLSVAVKYGDSCCWGWCSLLRVTNPEVLVFSCACCKSRGKPASSRWRSIPSYGEKHICAGYGMIRTLCIQSNVRERQYLSLYRRNFDVRYVGCFAYVLLRGRPVLAVFMHSVGAVLIRFQDWRLNHFLKHHDVCRQAFTTAGWNVVVDPEVLECGLKLVEGT